MKLRDIVELSFQRFRTRSLRFILTILGVGVGIGVVFFLVTLGFGLQEVVIGRIATSESLLSLTVSLPEEAQEFLSIDDPKVEELKKIEFVRDISPVLSLPAELEYNDLKAQTLAQAVEPSYFDYSGIEAVGGELFKEGDSNVVVVSRSVFRLFDIAENDALGKELSSTYVFAKPPPAGEETDQTTEVFTLLNFGQPLRIVGFVESDANAIFVPLKLFAAQEQRRYSQLKIRVDSTEHINPVRSQLIEKGYAVIALTDTLDQLNRIFRFTQIALGIMGIVALFIASVGMFNTLTISLLERTHEVGILKAIGATSKDVWMIFLFEALLIGTLGGIAGIFGGYVSAKLVNVGLNITARRFGGEAVNLFHIPLWFVASILGIAISVGFITGLYPARRAAHLNPLKALKTE